MKAGSKLGLGTVQWGMPYGIANVSGQPSPAEIDKMIERARDQGVTLLDTAWAYGEAESVLGSLVAASRGFDIVTKTRPLSVGIEPGQDEANAVGEGFLQSLQRMRCSSAYGLLVHRAEDLLSASGDSLWRMLQSLKARGLVAKLGVSVYHPHELEAVCGIYSIDIVQLPLNIYDQRFLESGLLTRLQARGVEIHVRSAFLQGLLLMPAASLPACFDSIRERQGRLHRAQEDMGLSPLEGALGYCLCREEVDRVIVGCETAVQLAGIFEAERKIGSGNMDALDSYALADPQVILPSHWPAMPAESSGARESVA